ncbi:MAG: 5-(carboxyamino)imidazole ribonucleotide mutase [Bacteroidales bacterium]|nr:5-(carboxyamino)imidazole ribonucleotide mutase [Bacteroidales bacterium]MBQ9583073.1 5-(carboxyamino)imidazole ribonucleotide mutase [Bacteroidales bacterium]
MTPVVSIIMGSVSDMPVVRPAADFLEQMEIPFEIHALSAHRTPQLVAKVAEGAAARGVKVIIAAAGGAAHLPGVIAASTTLPVIGIPVKSSNSMDGWDSVLSILQMPSGIPVATMALDGAKNAAIFAMQILATGDPALAAKLAGFKESLKTKVSKANDELKKIEYKFKTN